jgi:hypothetical protein
MQQAIPRVILEDLSAEGNRISKKALESRAASPRVTLRLRPDQKPPIGVKI